MYLSDCFDTLHRALISESLKSHMLRLIRILCLSSQGRPSSALRIPPVLNLRLATCVLLLSVDVERGKHRDDRRPNEDQPPRECLQEEEVSHGG